MERMELLDQIETGWLDWQGLLSRLTPADMDAQNDAYFALNKERALDDVLGESHRVHRQLVDAITALTDEQYHDRDLLGTPPDEQWELEKLIDGNTFKHYPDHAEVIRDWLASRE